MSDELTALVLGVGGNVSQGILKALAMSDLDCRVVAACISSMSAGLYTADRGYVSPYADDPAFSGWLFDVCREEEVDVVMSGTEPVLAVLSEKSDELRERCGTRTIVSTPECLAIGHDKLRTAEWLAANGFNAPRSAAAQDQEAVAALVKDCGLPLIAKPRAGRSAEGFLDITDERGLEHIRGEPDYVVQERLGAPDSEYTVGCLSDREGAVRGAMVMRRELLQGTTVRAEAVDAPEVRDEAVRIVEALRPLGPSNVQLRVSDGKPICFEINVRFSGTAPIRARLGFNDVEAAIRHFVLDEPATDLPAITEGIALRYWNEMYVDPAATEELKSKGRLDDPSAHPLNLEDYGGR